MTSSSRSVRCVLSTFALSLSFSLLLAGSALAAGDVNRGGCPNEANTGFSSALPDCRAYEQVSPAFKNGFGPGTPILLGSGASLFTQTIGPYNGATPDRDCVENSLEFSRGASAWTTTALTDAPLAELSYEAAICSEVVVNEQGTSLLVLRPTAGSAYAANLYLHQPSSGAFVEVGPLLPESAVPPTPTGERDLVGEQPVTAFADFYPTPDFSHVLFQLPARAEPRPGVQSFLWPGDTTESGDVNASHNSLYEYAGVGNTSPPTLVGLENHGALLSDCATLPGGEIPVGFGGRNVISADGSRVFFTASGADNTACKSSTHAPAVSALFARVHSGAAQSPANANGQCTVVADACTVAISEPGALAPAQPNEECKSTTCKENTELPSGSAVNPNWRGAQFEGASADGSKVFFTSTQQLTDAASQDPNPTDSAIGSRTGIKECYATTGADGCNLYMYDFDRPEGHGLVALSTGDTSGLGPEVQGIAGLSEDGSHIYFVARGVLTGAQPDEYGAVAEPGEENLYVANTTDDQTTFVATLARGDSAQWESSSGIAPGNVTGNGGFFVFTSIRALTPDDTSNAQQVFRYDATNGELVRVSVGNSGFNQDGNSATAPAEIARESYPELVNEDSHPAISEDGQTVVFGSADALTPAAFDNRCAEYKEGQCEYAKNVYEYRAGHVYLIYGGSGTTPATNAGGAVSSSGADIYFTTPDSLVPSDTDTLEDLYDVREDGGGPAFAAPAACQGDACQAVSNPAPAFATPASATPSGEGPLTPPAIASLPKPKPKPKSLTRAQKLAKALHTCRQKRKQTRTSCERAARRKYGAKAKKAKSNRRTGR